jgi:hypothetical protein
MLCYVGWGRAWVVKCVNGGVEEGGERSQRETQKNVIHYTFFIVGIVSVVLSLVCLKIVLLL